MRRTPAENSTRCTRLNGYCAIALAPRVELRDANRFLDDALLPVDRRESLAEAAGHIRQVLDDDAPVPARLAIEIDRLRAGLLDAARRLHRRAEHVVAEQVAEEERDAAGRVGAEAIGADADRRLADLSSCSLAW